MTARIGLEELYEERLRAVEVESPPEVWVEIGLIITPAMREAASKRNRATEKSLKRVVLWA